MQFLAIVNKKFAHLFVERENVDVIAVKLHRSFTFLFKSCLWTLKIFLVEELLPRVSKEGGGSRFVSAHSLSKF